MSQPYPQESVGMLDFTRTLAARVFSFWGFVLSIVALLLFRRFTPVQLQMDSRYRIVAPRTSPDQLARSKRAASKHSRASRRHTISVPAPPTSGPSPSVDLQTGETLPVGPVDSLAPVPLSGKSKSARYPQRQVTRILGGASDLVSGGVSSSGALIKPALRNIQRRATIVIPPKRARDAFRRSLTFANSPVVVVCDSTPPSDSPSPMSADETSSSDSSTNSPVNRPRSVSVGAPCAPAVLPKTKRVELRMASFIPASSSPSVTFADTPNVRSKPRKECKAILEDDVSSDSTVVEVLPAAEASKLDSDNSRPPKASDARLKRTFSRFPRQMLKPIVTAFNGKDNSLVSDRAIAL